MTFDLARSVVFDIEVYPGRWCVGFLGEGRGGRVETTIVDGDRGRLARTLRRLAATGRILVGYNSAAFDIPLIGAILGGIDPHEPAQSIIRDGRLPEPLWNLPRFPCDHVDLAARLRRGGGFPGLKTVAANLGRPTLLELPYPPDAALTDQQWAEVRRYNAIDLAHTRAILERFAPELQALAVLSEELGQDLRSTPTPRVVEVVFLDAYRREHGVDPPHPEQPERVFYRPIAGVAKPATPAAAAWYARILEPLPMVGTAGRMRPDVPRAQFPIGRLKLSVGAGGLHSLDGPGVSYATRKARLVSVDVASFYPCLIAAKNIASRSYGDAGASIYRGILDRRLDVKRRAKVASDPAERERLDIQATALKLVLNATFGKLGDPHSSLYDPAAFLAVTLSGELMLIDLIERLTAAKVRVLSANTDGLFLRVPRRGRRWRRILADWQRDTGMTLEVEGLKRLAIVATNNFATLGAKGQVKRKGDKLKGSLSPFASCNSLVVNDAVAEALLRDVPPETTVWACSDPVRFCRVSRRTGKVSSAVLQDGTGGEIELPRVARWYKAKDSRRHIVHRFGDGHHTTPPGAVGINLALDLADGRLPEDLDRGWYIAEARRVIQKVGGYRHRSPRRLQGHPLAVEVRDAGLVPCPKWDGKKVLPGADPARPTYLWDWSRIATVGTYTGSTTGILVLDVDEPGKFAKWIDRCATLFSGSRWDDFRGCLVSVRGEPAALDVRTGKARGKVIFRLEAPPDHPLAKLAIARWKKPRGVEVFFGKGIPSVLGEHPSGERYRLEGTLGEAPVWLVTELAPARGAARKKPSAPSANHWPGAPSAPHAPSVQEAVAIEVACDPQRVVSAPGTGDDLDRLEEDLASLAPELHSVPWRRKDHDGRVILVGRCPFEHESGRNGDADLSAGFHEDRPYVHCLHASCTRIRQIDGRLRAEEGAGDDGPAPAVADSDPVPSQEGGAPGSPDRSAAKGDRDRETHAEVLLRLASAATLYHTAEGRAYVEVPVAGHRENHEVRSAGFRRWLTRAFYEEQGRPPSSEAMQSALGVLEANAIFKGRPEIVHVRVGSREGACYLDLGDASWRVVEIRPGGWGVIDRSPVRFRRPNGLRELPLPRRGGSIDLLKGFVNLGDDDYLLLVTWLTAAYRPAGPYPILALLGEQGSAKTTLSRLARRFVDPHVSLLRSEPKEPRDLMIAATNSWVVAIDNVSRMLGWLSDAFSRLATGGGYATRALCTDSEEVFFDAQRPVILNGIEDFIGRGDLVDRCLFLRPPAIPDGSRKTEAKFWAEFDAQYPLILGALLEAVSGGLRRLPDVKLQALPRMADFAEWGEAVAMALGWKPGKFLEVYAGNRQSAGEMILEDSPVAQAVRDLALKCPGWSDTPSKLLEELSALVGEKVRQSKRWPRTVKGLSGALRRLAPTLRTIGVHVTFDRDMHRRYVTVSTEAPLKVGADAPYPSFASSSPVSRPKRMTDPNGDPSCIRHDPSCEPPENRPDDAHDANDDSIPTLPGDSWEPEDPDDEVPF
jgi:hypothetical protein